LLRDAIASVADVGIGELLGERARSVADVGIGELLAERARSVADVGIGEPLGERALSIGLLDGARVALVGVERSTVAPRETDQPAGSGSSSLAESRVLIALAGRPGDPGGGGGVVGGLARSTFDGTIGLALVGGRGALPSWRSTFG
jgi:hypothetical protein